MGKSALSRELNCQYHFIQEYYLEAEQISSSHDENHSATGPIRVHQRRSPDWPGKPLRLQMPSRQVCVEEVGLRAFRDYVGFGVYGFGCLGPFERS